MKHVVLNRYPIGNKRFIWKQKNFTLSTFAGVPQGDNGEGEPKEFCDKYVKHLKEAGFTMMELGWVNHENAWLAVDACEKYELDLLFQDMSIMGGMNKHHLDNKVPYEVAENLVNALKDKKHTIGFYVWDEPCTEEQLKEARRQMDMLEKAAPEKLLFTVTIPSYNNEDEKRGFLWENGQYAPYTERFVRAMDPPVHSFDYYPVGNYFNAWLDHKFTRENQLDDTYMWLDMAQHRKLARENNLPFWFYYQSCPLYQCTDYFIFPMVRCFMYGAILYGAKGLQGYSVGTKNNMFCKPNGDKDVFFEDQKKIHGEIAALGNTLMALESKMIYHSAELLPGCEYIKPLIEKIEDSEIFKGELPHRTSVGELEDAYGNRYVVILNRDYEKPLSATLEMKDAFRVYEVSKEDGKQYVLHENTTELPINLEPGDAVVLRVQKASEEAFTIEYKLVD
ncbi:MAG: hypothetical protein IJN46_10530 [Lachnospiraceae bacterium]|nr:hypothetical protein [Lachnospiraceae bacterium]